MDRNTNLRDMDAPGVASGKQAGDTILAPKGLATYPLPSEKGSNTLEENVTAKQPTSGASGQAAFK
jgi:hypothetical protein